MYAHVDFPACRHVRICWVHCGWNTLCLSIWPYCFLFQLPMFPVKSPPLKHYTSIYFNSSRVILLETSWDFNPQMVFPWLSWHLGPPDDFFQNMAPPTADQRPPGPSSKSLSPITACASSCAASSTLPGSWPACGGNLGQGWNHQEMASVVLKKHYEKLWQYMYLIFSDYITYMNILNCIFDREHT